MYMYLDGGPLCLVEVFQEQSNQSLNGSVPPLQETPPILHGLITFDLFTGGSRRAGLLRSTQRWCGRLQVVVDRNPLQLLPVGCTVLYHVDHQAQALRGGGGAGAAPGGAGWG